MTTVSVTAPPRQTAPHEDGLAGMRCLDTMGNPRIPVLMELVGALSRASEPREVLRVFGEGINRLFGPRGYVSLSTRGLKPGQYRITRMLTKLDDQTRAHVADPWKNPDQISVHTGGFFGEIIRKAYPEVIHYLNVQDDPVFGDALAEFRSLMAIPLFDQGEPLNWAISLSEKPEEFTIDELEQSILRGNLVGGTVKNTLISQQLREANQVIRREVEEVAHIQRALLPPRLPDIAGAKFTVSYETYDQAGGDYYDFIPLQGCTTDLRCTTECDFDDPNSPWGIFIGDASGHGPGAAVIMAILHTLLHSYPKVPDNPAEVLDHMNEHLSSKQIPGTFATAFFGIYDPKTRELSYAVAGHPPPLLKNEGPGGAVTRLDAVGSLPLGVLLDTKYETASVRLATNQSVVMYTDGITEAMSPNGKMFGVEGIELALDQCSGDPDCVVHSITEPLREHEGGICPRDDQTILAMKVVE